MKGHTMAKRYHSSMISETSGDCHLPEEVIVKKIPSGVRFEEGKNMKDLYTLAEERLAENSSELRKLTNPKKI